MSSNPVLEKLQNGIYHLESTQKRFSRTIPVADAVDRSMPYNGLSSGCIHEVKGADLSSALAFSSILSKRIAGDEGNIVFIAPDRSLHPLGLLPYGMKLNQVLFIRAQRSKDLAWAAMEALRCPQVSVVLAVLAGVDLTDSRRLQLAAENSGATGFLVERMNSAPVAAPITRWQITPNAGRPGQRFDEPTWIVDLLYCRGGRPASWVIEWRSQRLSIVYNKLAQQAPAAGQVSREALAG